MSAVMSTPALTDKLKSHSVLPNEGGGDCLFYALNQCLDRTVTDSISASFLRKQLVDYIEANPYRTGFGFEDVATFRDYVRKMRCDGEWGDYHVLRAASCMYDCKINLYCTPNVDFPNGHHAVGEGTCSLDLKYNGGHYEALVPKASLSNSSEDEDLALALALSEETPSPSNSSEMCEELQLEEIMKESARLAQEEADHRLAFQLANE